MGWVRTQSNWPRASKLRRVLEPDGTLVIVGAENCGNWLGPMKRTFAAAALSPFVKQTLRTPFLAERAEDLEYLRAALEDGGIKPVVDRTYALDDVPEAIRYLNQGRARGKVVVTV